MKDIEKSLNEMIEKYEEIALNAKAAAILLAVYNEYRPCKRSRLGDNISYIDDKIEDIIKSMSILNVEIFDE